LKGITTPQVSSFVGEIWFSDTNPFGTGAVLLPFISSSNRLRYITLSANIREQYHYLIDSHLRYVSIFLRTIDHVQILHWNGLLGCRFDCHLYKHKLMGGMVNCALQGVTYDQSHQTVVRRCCKLTFSYNKNVDIKFKVNKIESQII
jgi:hypothetical protein